jgi:uncharacterized MAPEG superfamily protein
MTNTLSTELYWLTLTTIMTAVLWLPYIINRMLELGILQALWDPFGETKTNKAWATRMMQAHTNAVENLVVFAPLVFLVQITDAHSEVTAMACMIYFFARLVHYIVFTFAIPLLRVLSFLTAFGAQLALGLAVL